MRSLVIGKSSAPITVVAGLSVVIAGLPLLSGCGSGGHTTNLSGGTTKAARGVLNLSIKWPERPVTVPGRVVPLAANSIVLTLTPVATVTGRLVPGSPVTLTVTRPTTAGTQPTVSNPTFPNLELGTYTLTAVAYPNADGTGTAQATGPQAGQAGTATAPVTVVAGVNAVGITLFATVQSVVLSVAGPTTVPTGGTVTLSATAYDGPSGTGNIIITTGSLVFTSSDTTKVSLSTPVLGGPGQSTTVATGLGRGSSIVTAQYAEPGIAPGAQGTGASATLTISVGKVGLDVTNAWGKFHGDAQNTGQALAGSGTSLTLGTIGSFAIGGQVELSSPAISHDGKTLYVGANDNNLYAIDISSGTPKLKWTFPTQGMVESSPLIDRDDTIYFGSSDGNVYAITDNATASKTLWTFKAGSPIVGSPNLDDKGVLYVATDAPDSKLYFLNSITGQPTVVLSGPKANTQPTFTGSTNGYQVTPALNVAQDRVYITDEAGNVYEISTADGIVKGTYKLPAGAQYSSPVIGNVGGQERMFQGTTDGHLYAFNAAVVGAGPIWNYQATGSIYATPAYSAASGTLFVATYDNTSGQFDSRVAAVNASTGTELARTGQLGAPNGPLYGPGSPVPATAPPGTTPSLNPGTSFTSYYSANDPGAQNFTFTSSPALSADGTMLYVGCDNGYVYGISTVINPQPAAVSPPVPGQNPIPGLDATEGFLNIQFAAAAQGAGPQSPIILDSSPAIGPDGKVYIGGFDGNIYTISQ